MKAKRPRLDPKRPGKLLPTEHQIQSAYFDWVRMTYPDTKLIYAVPNGANKSPAQRMKFKREGLTPGIPDVNIDHPRGRYHGMRIEFKRPGERASPDQLEALQQLKEAGYHAFLCSSAEVAINETEKYLAL